jgi:hypothetical protein
MELLIILGLIWLAVV